MSFENPAIAGRRLYLLDVATGEYRRLNEIDAFQDAPVWQADGERLYYVQGDGSRLSLVGFELDTGEMYEVPESRRPMPQAVGYYGQSAWDDLLAYHPDAPRLSLPALTEVYTDATLGFTLNYPAGWAITDGWQALGGWQTMPTLLPPGGAVNLGPFSARIHLAIEAFPYVEGEVSDVLETVLMQPGPGQGLGLDQQLIPYNQEFLEVDSHPSVRLDTLGDSGEVNHVLLVLLAEEAQGLVLRGQGDGALFDAIVGTLQFSTIEAIPKEINS